MTAIEDDLTRTHGIVGTHQGAQGAGQTIPEDSICCMTCGWMRCSDYSAHLAAALAPIVAAHVAAGQEQALLDAADEQERLSKAPTALKSRAVQFKRLIFANWLRDRAATYTTTKENDHG